MPYWKKLDRELEFFGSSLNAMFWEFALAQEMWWSLVFHPQKNITVCRVDLIIKQEFFCFYILSRIPSYVDNMLMGTNQLALRIQSQGDLGLEVAGRVLRILLYLTFRRHVFANTSKGLKLKRLGT